MKKELSLHFVDVLMLEKQQAMFVQKLPHQPVVFGVHAQ
jgi:hypothetical protein